MKKYLGLFIFILAIVPISLIVNGCGQTKISLNKVDMGFSIENLSVDFTGLAHKPEFYVKYQDVSLTAEEDYIYEFSNNINAGTAKLEITGMGDFEGKKTLEFVINPIEITATDVTVATQSLQFSGFEHKPNISVTKVLNPEVNTAKTTLIKDWDYTVAYEDNIMAGTAEIIITAKGNYFGEITKEFEITPLSLTDASIVMDSQSIVFTGSEIEPNLDVYYNQAKLTKYLDYNVELSNNINVGTAEIKVTGIGNYEGQKAATFEITKAQANRLNIGLIEDTEFEYTGSEIRPEITEVKLADYVLLAEEYSIEYVNNVNVVYSGQDIVSSAYVLITCSGDNFEGTHKVYYKIIPRDIPQEIDGAGVIALTHVSLESLTYNYTGSEIQPKVEAVYNGITLAENQDYSLSYENNIEVGTGSVKIKFAGNYKGEMTLNFQIAEVAE